MSQSNDILEPRLVAVDSHELSLVDDYIQIYAEDCESLACALNMIEVSDPASKGVIVAVKAALLSINDSAIGLSESIMTQLILMPELEVNPYEQQ